MAQTNFTPILLYASSTAAAVPLAANLTNSATGSEIAINVADKNLFFKDSTNAVNTVPIRQSSTSSNGWLSSTDWNTFNNKQPAGTYVTSVTGTAPVVSSGGTTPAISMAAATTSVNGYLTSTDWTTFNGKAPGVTFTTGYIPYGQGTTTLNQSANFFFDGTNLGLGTSTPSTGSLNRQLTINSAATNLAGIVMQNNATGTAFNDGFQVFLNASDGNITNNEAGNLIFATSATEAMRVHGSGGVSIGNTTDPGAGGLKVSGAISAVIAYQASLALGAAWNPTIPTIGVSQLWQFTFVSVTPAIPRIVTGMLSSDSAGAVTWHGILTELGMYVDTSGTLRFINNTATVINVYLTGTRLL